MIPEYLALILGLAALAYTVRSLADTYFMIKDYQENQKWCSARAMRKRDSIDEEWWFILPRTLPDYILPAQKQPVDGWLSCRPLHFPLPIGLLPCAHAHRLIRSESAKTSLMCGPISAHTLIGATARLGDVWTAVSVSGLEGKAAVNSRHWFYWFTWIQSYQTDRDLPTESICEALLKAIY